MASEGKSDGATGGAGGVGTPRRAQAALSESKAREVMTEEAKKAAPLGWWPTGSSPEDLKFMLESVMSIVERQNTTIRRLQAQVTELWRENTLRGKSSAFDKSEKLVVVGFTRYVEAYSHDTNDWREMPSMPTARRDCAVASCGGKLYVIGGTSSSTGRVVGTVEVYDPVTRVWSEAAPLRKPRALAAAVEFNGEVAVVGGSDDANSLDTVEVFDPDAGKWRMLAAMGEARESPAAVSFKGNLVVAGGRHATTGVATQTVEQYDADTGKWRSMVSLPKPLGSCSASVLDGRLVVAGNGQTSGGSGNVPGAVFVLEHEVWHTLPDRMVTASSSALALETLNGRLVAVASEGAEEYDEVIDDWIALPQSRVRHFGCDAAVLPSQPSELATPSTPV